MGTLLAGLAVRLPKCWQRIQVSPGVAVLTLALGIGAKHGQFLRLCTECYCARLPFRSPIASSSLPNPIKAQSDEMSLTWNQLERLRELRPAYSSAPPATPTLVSNLGYRK